MRRAVTLAVALIALGACGKTERSQGQPPPTNSGGEAGSAVETDHVSIRLVSGDEHLCSLGQDGRVRCWESLLPGSSRDLGLEGVRELASGPSRVCASNLFFHVYCWGAGEEPVQVGGLEFGRQLVVSADASCALDLAAELHCWGRQQDGTLQPDPVPVVRPPGAIRALRGGPSTISVLYDDGYLWSPKAWSRQREISYALETSDVATSASHECRLTSSGNVWCTQPGFEHFALREQVNFVALGASEGFTCGLGEEQRAIFCTNGTSSDDTWLQLEQDPLFALELSAGRVHVCVRTENGSIVCWGDVPGRGPQDTNSVTLVLSSAGPLAEDGPTRLPPTEVGAYAEARVHRATALCECFFPDSDLSSCVLEEGASFNLRCMKASASADIALGLSCRTEQIVLDAECYENFCPAPAYCPLPLPCDGQDFPEICRDPCQLETRPPAAQVCDGLVDCPDGTDEGSCSAG